jgi:hypothetical protein
MGFRSHSKKWASTSGVATADLVTEGGYQGATALQCTIRDITTGTGIVTFTAKASDGDAFEPVYDKDGNAMTVNLATANGSRTVTIDGHCLDQIKASSSSSSDAFSLLVGF